MLCEDHLGTGYSEGAPYYTVSYNTSGAASEAAADVVFVVDESGSVDMKRQWIRDVRTVAVCVSATGIIECALVSK